MNENFRPLFEDVNELKDRMRKCTTYDQWQSLKNEYKLILTAARQVYTQHSNEDKYNAFKDRENTAIAAIYQKVKTCWESPTDLADTVNDDTPKVYNYYDSSKQASDLEKEIDYWQTQLFPKALEKNLQEWQITLEYNRHLRQQYWHNLAGNPDIAFANEMRRHYGIYRKEHQGQNTPNYILED